jgi:hypothetical protein
MLVKLTPDGSTSARCALFFFILKIDKNVDNLETFNSKWKIRVDLESSILKIFYVFFLSLFFL